MPNDCRWGILGTANIARKNWKAIRWSGNGVVTAVASRDPAKADLFIKECQGEVPFAAVATGCTYDDLLKRDDVDAVYIPLPTGIRPEWVVKAAQAGKHVLCEKPCGASSVELKRMLDACKDAKVQFMDGVMFMHSARLPLMRKVLDDGDTVGDIRRVTSQFSFAAPPEFFKDNIRAKSDMEPLGALGDLGWYNIRFSLFALKYEMPKFATGRLLKEHNGVPTEFSGELLYADGVSAGFYCSFVTELQQWANVSGTKGALSLVDFVVPQYGSESAFETDKTQQFMANTRFHMERHPTRHAVREYSDGAPTAQETNMVRRFGEIVASKKLDTFWPEVAWKTQVVLDACLRSARSGGGQVTV